MVQLTCALAGHTCCRPLNKSSCVQRSKYTGFQSLAFTSCCCDPAAAVTLFEGGRVYGAEVIAELIEELHASVAMSEGFEGEMKNLVAYAR